MDLSLAVKRRIGTMVAMCWWEHEGLDLEEMGTAAWEADQTEGKGEMHGTETARDI